MPTKMEIQNKFNRNEARLRQLADTGRYVYDDHRWPQLMREAARLEATQDRLLMILEMEA